MTDDLTIRSAVDADLTQLADLYNHYILTSPATFDTEPHTVETKRQWFANYSDAGPYRVMVAVEPGGRIVGHSYSSPALSQGRLQQQRRNECVPLAGRGRSRPRHQALECAV